MAVTEKRSIDLERIKRKQVPLQQQTVPLQQQLNQRVASDNTLQNPMIPCFVNPKRNEKPFGMQLDLFKEKRIVKQNRVNIWISFSRNFLVTISNQSQLDLYQKIQQRLLKINQLICWIKSC